MNQALKDFFNRKGMKIKTLALILVFVFCLKKKKKYCMAMLHYCCLACLCCFGKLIHLMLKIGHFRSLVGMYVSDFVAIKKVLLS